MRIYEVYYPQLAASAKFKTLAPEDTIAFRDKHRESPKIEYMLLVLNKCVYNLRTEILVALHKLSPMAADEILMALYNGCVMINPTLDGEVWADLTYSYNAFAKVDADLPTPEEPHIDFSPIKNDALVKTSDSTVSTPKKTKPATMSYAKYMNLEKTLNEKVVGQPEAIYKIVSALKRAHVSLNDPDRPLGVFLFCGPSGVGKTLIAKELQKYLFSGANLVRIDCGEYQHKHENQKLIGSPSGYVGYDEGGQLSKAIAKQPNTVLLLDEAEKAHPDFWNTFLKVFADGYLTDNKGNNISFKNVIVIITSNLGNDKLSDDTYGKKSGFTASLEDGYLSKKLPKRDAMIKSTNEAVRKFFKPEFVNRLDDIVIFNHLTQENFFTIAELELLYLADKLAKQGYKLAWNDDVLDLLKEMSGISIEGARGMSKVRRERLENLLADLLLSKKHSKGTIFNITVQEGNFYIS